MSAKIEKLVAAARRTLRVITWTPSRFAKWKECPSKVLYEDLMHMCPKCFVGRVSGGYEGEPVKCDTCSKPQPERPQLDRGNRLDDALTGHLAGFIHQKEPASEEKEWAAHEASMAEATRHPKIAALVKVLRKTKNVFTQVNIVLDKGWTSAPKGKFTKDAWARVKLDVLRLTPKQAIIIDWKSGNIDKSKGVIRERDEYHDSMRMYQAAVLSVYPQPEATATMAFLDAPPKLDDPFKPLVPLKRRDLARAQEVIERKLVPMLNDDQFAPKPGLYCGWCPFAKKAGGPCPFGN